MAKPTDNWVFVSQPEQTAMPEWQMLKSADAGDDYYGETLASTGQALKVLAQRKGIIRLRLVTDLINELLVQTAVHIRSSDDPSIQQIGERRLRELKQTLVGLV
jgi:hypothetical protein